jgi:hypothetical protein
VIDMSDVSRTNQRSQRSRLRLRACLAASALFLIALPAIALQRVDHDHLCVTNGSVSALSGGRLEVDTPSSRAIVTAGGDNAADQSAEIRFQYLGPTQDTKPLASGELRRQIGLKLRAADTCNLVYVMWRIEPESRVVVSIKRNPAMHTHEQCGTRGYINFRPQGGTQPAPMHPGERHTLRAELHGRDLTVTADGAAAWQGTLGTLPLPAGPAGFRTDNGRFTFRFLTDALAGSRPAAQQPSQCVLSEGD